MNKHIGLQFLEASSYRHTGESDQKKGLPQPPLEMPYEGKTIDLPNPLKAVLPDLSLKEALLRRESIRKYKHEPITMDELSYALHMTQGIRMMKGTAATLRTVPSAGARHAFETIILVNKVIGLESGLYRYIASEHKLLPLKSEPDIANRLVEACREQTMVGDAAVTLFWIADAYRMTYRFAMRGYRYLFIDAGHVCQNLYLVAHQLGCATCAIGAFDDEHLNDILKLDGENQFVVYAAPLGKV